MTRGSRAISLQLGQSPKKIGDHAADIALFPNAVIFVALLETVEVGHR